MDDELGEMANLDVGLWVKLRVLYRSADIRVAFPRRPGNIKLLLCKGLRALECSVNLACHCPSVRSQGEYHRYNIIVPVISLLWGMD